MKGVCFLKEGSFLKCKQKLFQGFYTFTINTIKLPRVLQVEWIKQQK